ncbi:MAG: 2OG-Fe(II) oxygenase [Caulobacteraceae bacterium]|nr:2OG-Fe(II) oxygenase [Caulobacteraceae bacterium]
MTDTAADTLSFRQLLPGEPAPWFNCPTTTAPDFAFDVVAGRYLVLAFFGSAGDAKGRAALDFPQKHRDLFDDEHIAYFGVSADAADTARTPAGTRVFLDLDRRVARLYGVAPDADPRPGQLVLRRSWFVLDPQLRIIDTFPMADDGSDHARLAALLAGLPPVGRFTGIETHAPVLYLPNVFEPEFCQALIDVYDAQGGQLSGFMRDVGGKTTRIHDADHKVRRDVLLGEEDPLRLEVRRRIVRRLIPAIHHAYQFTVTRLERYLVACYTADDGGHFRAHRDNTTKGTAHRRFAVSINLSGDFDGGEVGFPEFGTRTYKPPPGGAVVFSCSLLHRVTRVTRGRRYAFLPFLYDDAAAELRNANRAFFSPELLAEGATHDRPGA